MNSLLDLFFDDESDESDDDFEMAAVLIAEMEEMERNKQPKRGGSVQGREAVHFKEFFPFICVANIYVNNEWQDACTYNQGKKARENRIWVAYGLLWVSAAQVQNMSDKVLVICWRR